MRLEVENVSASDLTRRIRIAVEEATGPLKHEVSQLREELRRRRGVVTHKAAPAYFDYEIGPGRVLDYIKGKHLPAGVELPLPANKIGNIYYIEVPVLERWQAGRATADDLYAWQRKRMRP